jgi:hypothetical protein
MDDRLLTWARLPGPRKILAAARRRLEAGHGLGGSPLRVDLTPGERSEVGRLLGMSWERSGRAVGAKALAMAVENYGATVTDLTACARAHSWQGREDLTEKVGEEHRLDVGNVGISQGPIRGWTLRHPITEKPDLMRPA